MKITVKYSEWAGTMERSVETVKGSYNKEQKTIDVLVNDDHVEYLKILAMTDDQMMEMGQNMYGDAFTAETAAENRKSLLDYFWGVYGWTEKVTMAVAKHF